MWRWYRTCLNQSIFLVILWVVIWVSSHPWKVQLKRRNKKSKTEAWLRIEYFSRKMKIWRSNRGQFSHVFSHLSFWRLFIVFSFFCTKPINWFVITKWFEDWRKRTFCIKWVAAELHNVKYRILVEKKNDILCSRKLNRPVTNLSLFFHRPFP